MEGGTLTTVLLILLLSLAPAASPQRLRPDFVQPKTYTSDEGRHELRVDPSSRWGIQEAGYALTSEGSEAWTRLYPFTFVDARVTSEGAAVGYAYQRGITGTGDLVIAVLDADGTLRREERIPRVAQRASSHKDPVPWVRGLFLQESEDRFVIRVADADFWSQDESWWVFRLSTGEPVTRWDLHDGMQDPRFARWSLRAEPLPETPLVLSQWDAYKDGSGARFCLSDGEGKIVWQLDRPLEYTLEGGTRSEPSGANGFSVSKSTEQSELDDHIRRLGAIRSLGPGPRFALWLARDTALVTFEVSGDVASGWSVREVGRERLQLDEVLHPPETEPLEPLAPLEELGTTSFSVPSKAELKISAVTLDDHGQVYMAEAGLMTIDVFVFDAGRNWVRTCTRTGYPSDARTLSVRGDGHLFVTTEWNSATEFAPDGTRIGALKLDGMRLFVPGSARSWHSYVDGVTLIDEDGSELCRLLRTSQGRWFDSPDLLTVSPDGEPVIGTRELEGRSTVQLLDLRDASGGPQGVIRLRAKEKYSRILAARRGERVALVAEQELRVHALDGTPLASRALTGPFAKAAGLFFSPDGRELWVFANDAQLLRLAVP